MKIFGIGLSKTGTSSLAQALQRLGYRTRDCMGATRYVAGDLSSIDMDTVLAHDALTDTPIPSFYRELDARFPGSKFILTVRDRDGWLQSCKKQFNERSAAAQNDAHRRIFEDFYGTNVFEADGFARGYERFVASVMAYFKDRPQDLLVMNISAGDGWEKLCPFLGCTVPDIPFPKANVTKLRWMNIDDLVSIAEAAGCELLDRFEGDIAPAARSESGLRSIRPTRIIDRAINATLGRDATATAESRAYKVITTSLKRLTPEIAVQSPAEEPAPYAERKHWNHAWLVDPLDGREAFAGGRSDFTVNLALVEDGRPIYGVVHAPARGATYFGRIGKGVLKRVGRAAPVHLPVEDSEGVSASQANVLEVNGDGGSRSLAMCSLLERRSSTPLVFGATKEWRAAAAHALLCLAEMRVFDNESLRDHPYNSPDLVVPALTVLAKKPN